MKHEKHRVEVHHDGHKYEYHMDSDMHKDVHEKVHGHRNKPYHEMHRDGGLMEEEVYKGICGGSLKDRDGMRSLERERKMEGGGRMARQEKQRLGLGMRDDTVYGKLPPVPGRIDS